MNTLRRYEQLFMSLRQKDPPTFTRLTGSLRAKSNNALSNTDAASLSDALRRKDASGITFSRSTEMMASLMKKDTASLQNHWSASLVMYSPIGLLGGSISFTDTQSPEHRIVYPAFPYNKPILYVFLFFQVQSILLDSNTYSAAKMWRR